MSLLPVALTKSWDGGGGGAGGGRKLFSIFVFLFLLKRQATITSPKYRKALKNFFASGCTDKKVGTGVEEFFVKVIFIFFKYTDYRVV